MIWDILLITLIIVTLIAWTWAFIRKFRNESLDEYISRKQASGELMQPTNEDIRLFRAFKLPMLNIDANILSKKVERAIKTLENGWSPVVNTKYDLGVQLGDIYIEFWKPNSWENKEVRMIKVKDQTQYDHGIELTKSQKKRLQNIINQI